MSVFDVHDNVEKEINRIVFAEESSLSGIIHAQGIVRSENHESCVALIDEDYEYEIGGGYVLVSSKEHAENLIKALQKAIEIGWLK